MDFGSDDEERQVGDYMLLEVIGEGSFSEVRQAIHQKKLKRCAVKEINMHKVKRAKNAMTMVKTEISIMKTLAKRSHKNVIQVLEVLEEKNVDGMDCVDIVMELIEGCSLRNLMETLEGRRMDPDQMRSYFRQMLSGTAHCHSLGVIHRDIKPANLMITIPGVVKLVDFGVAEMMNMYADDSQVIGMRTRGSPAFQPPEVASGRGGLGTAIDVWSAGVTLFFAITGDVPFSSTSVPALYEAIIEEQLRIPDWVMEQHSTLADLITLMLRKDEKDRPGIDDLLHNAWVEDPAGAKLYRPQITQVNTQSVYSKLEGIYGVEEPEQESEPLASPARQWGCSPHSRDTSPKKLQYEEGEQSQAQPLEASAMEADVGGQTCTDSERQSAAAPQEVPPESTADTLAPASAKLVPSASSGGKNRMGSRPCVDVRPWCDKSACELS